MKDAVGSSLLVYLVIIVVGIVGACVIASNAYSKAYKAKNNIITSIDKYYLVNTDSGEETPSITDCFQDEICKTTIKNTLNNMGYKLSVTFDDCNSEQIRKKINSNVDINTKKSEIIYPTGDEKSDGYCIYKSFVNDVETEYYYTVVTFSHLNINVLGIGTLFKTPVYGETRVYYDYTKGA